MDAGSASTADGAKTLESLAGGLLALPPEQIPGKNDVVNSRFENGASGWTAPRCWSVDASVTHTGARSLRFDAGSCPALPAVTLVAHEHPATRSYTLRAWVRTSKGSDLKVRVALHDRTDRGYILGATEFFEPGPTWQLLEKPDIDLQAIHDGHALEVSAVVKGSSGQAWFDDIEMIEQDPAPLSAFLVYPNFRGYLWSSGPQKIRVQVDVASPDAQRRKVQVTLKGEKGAAVKTAERAAEASQTIELDAAQLPLGSYQLETRLLEAQTGRELAAYPAYRVVKVGDDFRDTLVNYIAPDNFLVRKGKKQFVWGVYDRFSGRFRCQECLSSNVGAYESIPGFGASTLANYSDTLVSAEINILPFAGVNIERNQLRPWLQALDRRSVGHLQIVNNWTKGSRGFPAWAQGMKDQDLWQRLAATMRGQSGALGYYTYDEPQTDKIPAVFAQYKTLREADPGSIAYGALIGGTQVFRWRDMSDVLGCDPYPVGFPVSTDDFAYGATSEPPLLRTSVMTRETVRQVAGSRPVWMVLQLFRHNGKFPTYEQMKMQAYKAIINGATGILWWGFVSEKGLEAEWFVNNNQQAYSDFRRISHEVMALEPILLAPAHPEALASVSSSSIETLVKMDGKKLVIFASNFGEKPAGEVTMALAPSVVPASSSAEVYAEGRSVAVVTPDRNHGPGLQDNFGPYEAHVYVLDAK